MLPLHGIRGRSTGRRNSCRTGQATQGIGHAHVNHQLRGLRNRYGVQIGTAICIRRSDGVYTRREVGQVWSGSAIAPLEGIGRRPGHGAHVDSAVVKAKAGHVGGNVHYPNALILQDNDGTRSRCAGVGIRDGNGIRTRRQAGDQRRRPAGTATGKCKVAYRRQGSPRPGRRVRRYAVAAVARSPLRRVALAG